MSAITDIFTGFSTAITALTPATDSGAPAAWAAVPAMALLLEHPADRTFTVMLARGGSMRQVGSTGIGGQSDFEIKITVAFQLFNEGRGTAAWHVIMAEEMRKVLDRVLAYFRDGNVAGVTMIEEEDFSYTDSEDERIFYPVATWRLQYFDTIATA